MKKADSFQELFHKGRQCFEQRQYQNAEAIFTELLQSSQGLPDENMAQVYFWLGNLFHLKGQLGKATRALEKALELDPSHTEASIALSVMLNDISQYDRAKGVFERAQAQIKGGGQQKRASDPHVNKQLATRHFDLAEMYHSYQRYDEAIGEYRKTFQLDPNHLEARLKMAQSYHKKGAGQRAYEELQRLKKEFPHYIPARVALGVFYYGQGQVLEARSQWQKALSLDPKGREARMYLGLSQTATETTL